MPKETQRDTSIRGVKGNATRKLINAKLRKMRIPQCKRRFKTLRQTVPAITNCSPARHRLSFPVMENNRRYNGRLRPTSRRPIFLIGISIRNPPTPLQVPKGNRCSSNYTNMGLADRPSLPSISAQAIPQSGLLRLLQETSAVSNHRSTVPRSVLRIRTYFHRGFLRQEIPLADRHSTLSLRRLLRRRFSIRRKHISQRDTKASPRWRVTHGIDWPVPTMFRIKATTVFSTKIAAKQNSQRNRRWII